MHPATDNSAARLIAFHLPQFHPIPENDEWWGKGFTEWTNVTRSRPRFPGHDQPQLPADLGFYDLRLPEARAAQADLAREYGISGFCYYHYWFHGRRLLERPVNDILASGEPDFPFCLCWANEPWGRNWDGSNKLILVEQKYSPEDDLNHIRWLLRAFADPRYIRVDGKPLFLVYRFSHLPEPARTVERWRDEARKAGVGELFLCTVQAFDGTRGDPRSLGFDAAVEFAPDWIAINHLRLQFLGDARRALSRAKRCRRAALWLEWQVIHRIEPRVAMASSWVRSCRENWMIPYSSMMTSMLAKPIPDYRLFRGVCPAWDNSPRRRSDATIFLGSTPELYEGWLRELIAQQPTAGRSGDPIFVNAWNEWAEGCHLEPCQKWGRAYLEATRRAIGVAGTACLRL